MNTITLTEHRKSRQIIRKSPLSASDRMAVWNCWIIWTGLHRLSGYRKPHLTLIDSGSDILLVVSPFVKPASHRLCGKGLTNEANTRLYPLNRIKSVSGIRNNSSQSAGIMVSLDKNIQLPSTLGIKEAGRIWRFSLSPVTAHLHSQRMKLRQKCRKKICISLRIKTD